MTFILPAHMDICTGYFSTKTQTLFIKEHSFLLIRQNGIQQDASFYKRPCEYKTDYKNSYEPTKNQKMI